MTTCVSDTCRGIIERGGCLELLGHSRLWVGGVLVWKLVYIGLLDFNQIELCKKNLYLDILTELTVISETFQRCKTLSKAPKE